MITIEPLFISTTIITMMKDHEDKGTATGFFYFSQQANQTFLVTNKHVIYGENYSKNPSININKFRLRLHTNLNNLKLNEFLDISLFDSQGTKIWLEHNNSKIGVILLPINIDTKKFFYANIDDSFLNSEDLVVSFEKIFVIGYPYGWYDLVNNLPVSRIGHLSSPFNVDFNGEPIMLGDVETHPGMSGGPVFLWLNDYVKFDDKKRTKMLGSTKRILAGIHSGQPRWDLIDKTTSKIKCSANHSLINIWNSRLITEILGNSLLPTVPNPKLSP